MAITSAVVNAIQRADIDQQEQAIQTLCNLAEAQTRGRIALDCETLKPL